MLSIGKITGSPGSAAKYYVSGDYYSKDGNEPSEWAGKGAERLNLGGAVSAKDLAKLLSGVLPEGHQTGWQKANVWHHPGWDLTFSAPKGISIQSIVGGDTRLLKAHEKAVARALKFVESYAYVRVRGADQKVNYRQTGNIVAAKFTEFFSRALDPHLHTHAPISNMTYDKERGAWYALDSGALYAIKMAAGQVYRNELAATCLALGYEIFRNAETGLFDIKGIPEKLIDIYSSRRKQIIAYAREKGWKSAAVLSTATLLTRPDKAKTNHQKVVEDLKQRGVEYSSVSKLYAWAADRSGKAGPRRCLFGHADEMEPVQIPVQILRGDAAIATQEILQLAMATVDRLDVKGIPDPLSGRKLERLVANAHGGSAGPITAFAVGDENDIGVHSRFEDSFQRVRVDRRKNFADRRSAAVGSDQNRNLLMRQSALAGFAPAPPGLAVQCARSLVALKHISLVNLNDPLEFLRGLPHGRQEPVPPSEGRIDAKPAPAGRFPDRLALSQRRAERQPPFLVMKPRQRRSGRGIERAPAALALVAAKTPCPAA